MLVENIFIWSTQVYLILVLSISAKHLLQLNVTQLWPSKTLLDIDHLLWGTWPLGFSGRLHPSHQLLWCLHAEDFAIVLPKITQSNDLDPKTVTYSLSSTHNNIVQKWWIITITTIMIKHITLNMYLESRYWVCILEACSLGLNSQFATAEFRVSQF